MKKPDTNLNLNLRFLVVAIIAAYMGLLGGMVWQMEVTHRQVDQVAIDAKERAWEKAVDDAFDQGVSWGHAECNGEEDQ